MPAPEAMLDLYLHLAEASEAQARPLQRDKFLVLAAAIAERSGFRAIAEDCCRRIITHNPNHILAKFASMREAIETDEIQHYHHQLTRIYPFEKAEFLLQKFRAGGYSGEHGFGELAGGHVERPLASPPDNAEPHSKKKPSGSKRTSVSLEDPHENDFRTVLKDAAARRSFQQKRLVAEGEGLDAGQVFFEDEPKSALIHSIPLPWCLFGMVCAFAVGLAVGFLFRVP